MQNRHRTLQHAGLCVALAAVCLPGPAGAQIGRPWQVELGAFAAYTKYDRDHAGLRSALGTGGRFGIALSRVFTLEGRADFTQTDLQTSLEQADVTRLGGSLLAHVLATPFGRLYLGAGYSRLFYRGGVSATDDGAHAAVGDLLSLGGRAAIRLEGRLDYTPTSALSASGDAALNLGVTLGLSVFAFGGAARDSDRDRVPNKADRCSDTPTGVSVDAQGCPLDSDADGVFDGPDRCPDTPAGASIDVGGCPSDSDADQIYDGIDVCPNTPMGATIDVNGCPVDSDEDGVFDGLDLCPETPRGATVNPTGCPSDGDGDGLLDGLDRCPDTPAGTEVDANGCTVERDSDGDGVLDQRDRCPDTARGQQVDAVGCPILFLMEEGRARPLVLQGVTFETGRSVLTSESFAVLDVVAVSLLAHPEVRIEIAGHTDNTGSSAVNRRLSLARAQAVKIYLGRKGVEPSRMLARGYGPDQPIAPNSTAAGRAQNRRVELRQLEDGQDN